MNLGDFTVECLGVDYSDYFPGYGLGPKSEYTDCVYGIGNTEAEALEDCMEMMAQSGRIEWSDDVEQRIRDEYGHADDNVTAADEAGCEDVDCYGGPYFHVGIKWNIREEQRVQRVRNLPGVRPLRYESYERGSDGSWGYVEKAGGSASYGDFKDADWSDERELYFYVPYAGGSDYSGSTVEKANAKWFENEFGANEWVHSVYGGYGTYAVAVGLTGLLGCDDDTFEAVCEALEGLDNYPVFDDEALSELESETTDEEWDSWVAGDFRRAVEKKFDGCAEFEWPDDSALRTFFEEKRESANVYWENEGYGHSMYVDIDRVVEGIDLDDLEDYTVFYVVSYIDVGQVSEYFTVESEAIERVEALRAAGFVEAQYSVNSPEFSGN